MGDNNNTININNAFKNINAIGNNIPNTTNNSKPKNNLGSKSNKNVTSIKNTSNIGTNATPSNKSNRVVNNKSVSVTTPTSNTTKTNNKSTENKSTENKSVLDSLISGFSKSNDKNTGINLTKNSMITPATSTNISNVLQNASSSLGVNSAIEPSTSVNMNLTPDTVNGVPGTINMVSNALSNISEDISNVVNNTVEKVQESGESLLPTVIRVLITVGAIIAILYVVKYFYQKMKESSTSTSVLLDGTKNGKHALVITQDPTNPSYIPINRSDDKDGIQFTYNFWFLIESLDYKTGEWKHIFHKGNASSYPNRAPGVWIHPTKNIVRIYMNTQENILDFVDIDNIPIRKWVNMSIVLNNKNLDIYVNGFLKTRKELSSLPKQNDDNFWVNMYGGFEGYVSNISYYAYMIDFNEMDKIIRTGPSKEKCMDTNEVPPYLDDNWWYNVSTYTH